MDKLEQYRQWIQALLTEYVATPISNGAIESQTLFDTQRDHYQVTNVGWDGHRRLYRFNNFPLFWDREGKLLFPSFYKILSMLIREICWYYSQ